MSQFRENPTCERRSRPPQTPELAVVAFLRDEPIADPTDCDSAWGLELECPSSERTPHAKEGPVHPKHLNSLWLPSSVTSPLQIRLIVIPLGDWSWNVPVPREPHMRKK